MAGSLTPKKVPKVVHVHKREECGRAKSHLKTLCVSYTGVKEVKRFQQDFNVEFWHSLKGIFMKYTCQIPSAKIYFFN